MIVWRTCCFVCFLCLKWIWKIKEQQLDISVTFSSDNCWIIELKWRIMKLETRPGQISMLLKTLLSKKNRESVTVKEEQEPTRENKRRNPFSLWERSNQTTAMSTLYHKRARPCLVSKFSQSFSLVFFNLSFVHRVFYLHAIVFIHKSFVLNIKEIDVNVTVTLSFNGRFTEVNSCEDEDLVTILAWIHQLIENADDCVSW